MNDDIIQQAAREIADNHNKIIDDWCKAYLSQLYEEGHEIKPGCFTLNEQVPTYHKGQDALVKKYWFEPGTPQFETDGEMVERQHTHGWISVEDGYPKTSEDVLVVNEDGRMAVSCYFLARDMYVWEQRDDQIGLGTVTHWMPLPELPKREES